MITSGELLEGLAGYFSAESLGAYNDSPVEDPGRPFVTFQATDWPDTIVVMGVVACNPSSSEFDVAMHFRATSPTAVDAQADAIHEHFNSVFIDGRRFVGGTVATPMPSITLDTGVVLTNVSRRSRSAVELTAPKAQLNTNRFTRTDTYAVSVSRSA